MDRGQWLLCAVFISSMTCGRCGYYDASSGPSTTLTEWMANMDDGLSLSKLSIPGTHNTMSLYGGDLVQTQSWSLTDQLRAGIRFLDIRCRHYFHQLPIYHGSVYQFAYFDDVLRDVRHFLGEFPSEVILMRVKGEHTAIGNNQTMHSTVQSYITLLPAHAFWVSNRIPTLGESRGRIVFIKDFYGRNMGLSYSDIRKEEHWYVPTLFSWDMARKWNYIRNHLEEARMGHNSTLYLTYSSGVGIMAFPYSVAWRINYRLLHYLDRFGNHTSRFGIISMDFPGEILIDRIIQSNSNK